MIGNISHSLIHLLSRMCRPELKLIIKVPLAKFCVKLDGIGARIIKVLSCAERLSKIKKQSLATASNLDLVLYIICN